MSRLHAHFEHLAAAVYANSHAACPLAAQSQSNDISYPAEGHHITRR